MSPSAAVEYLDVINDIHPCFFRGLISCKTDLLGLKTVEEAFHHGMVLQLMLQTMPYCFSSIQQHLEIIAAILAATTRVVDKALAGLPAPISEQPLPV